MMEVMRIFKTLGLKPRARTHRALGRGRPDSWAHGFTRPSISARAQPKPELEKMAAYFNLDNGTGKIRGI